MDTALTYLAEAGFDIAHAFDTRAASREPGWELLADAPPLGLLIGNTRALWPRFVAAMTDPALVAKADPLDHYTEHTIGGALPGAVTYFSHRTYGAAFLPFQRLAVATGLGALAPSQLVIHPTFGPWFALRAVVAIEGEPPARAPITKPCVCAAPCATALARALDATAAGTATWRAWLAVREACSLRAWRYTDGQSAFHYTKEWCPQEGR